MEDENQISLSEFVSAEGGLSTDRVEFISSHAAVPVTLIEVASRRLEAA
jgi:hypothetical protein